MLPTVRRLLRVTSNLGLDYSLILWQKVLGTETDKLWFFQVLI